MKIFFRFDYNEVIGSGHLFRCLTLIKKLKNNKIFIICRSNSSEKKLIQEKLKKK